MTLKFAEYLDRSVLKNYKDTNHGNHLILYPTVYDFKIPYRSKDGESSTLDISFETKEAATKEWINTGGNIQESLDLQSIPISKLVPTDRKRKELGDILSSGLLSLPMIKIEQ